MRDALDKLIADLGRLHGATEVGALDEVNAQKLAWQEFGTDTAPARPTLTVTTDALTGAMHRAIDLQVRDVLDGKGRGVTGEEIVGDVGHDLAEQVREAIDGNTPPALAPSTVAKRRREGKDTRTLVDTGEMLRSIDVRTSDDPDAFVD